MSSIQLAHEGLRQARATRQLCHTARAKRPQPAKNRPLFQTKFSQTNQLAMNKLFIPSRVALFLMLIVASLSACKKNNDAVTPVPPADAATTVAGEYTFSELSYNGKVVSAADADLKGAINLTRKSATTVDMAVDLRAKSDNTEFIVETVTGVEVADLGSGTTALRYNGNQVAQIKSNKLTISGKDEDGVAFSITAAK